LKLSRLCAEQGFTTDARRWILEYAERQVQAGNVDAALAGLEEFADSTEEPGIRVLLAQQLAAHGQQQAAIEQLRTAHAMWLERGETHEAIAVVEKARAIDPGVDFGDDVASGPDAAPWPEADTPPPPAPGPPGDVRGLETRTDETDAAGAGPGTLGGLERFERADLGSEQYDDEEEPEPLPLLDADDDDEEEEVEPLPLLDDGGPDNAAEVEPVAEEPVAEEPVAEEP
ncbi:MAG: hypothetical protein GWM90_29845, partial [Gemmatimonadetes bacterium]|nr:hypothetical protein [Gemmatimonadota bacterium]NIQ59292.1 hypothetical protein [Gemmatimonadota bacterium]NIU79476.1 hypothetical protein [Gammaproteobacteria bacterium]NIX48120.1 hypothetical protein [Gemmatimonadota bacterium]NIY12502.1 hypothetical protein [Gemmatimonadota bacterium]